MLLPLFLTFFQIGLFSIGGGYAILPMVEQHVVGLHGWLTPVEYMDILTISQMTPGPIAINAATFVGTKMAGIPGALTATAGCVAPSFIIVLALSYFYMKYRSMSVIKGVLGTLRPAVVALIASSGISILRLSFWNGGPVVWSPQALDVIAVCVFALCFGVLRIRKPNPIAVILGTGVLGGALYLWL